MITNDDNVEEIIGELKTYSEKNTKKMLGYLYEKS